LRRARSGTNSLEQPTNSSLFPMTKPLLKLKRAPLKPPLLAVVTTGVGGQGKTTTALHLADAFMLAASPLALFQVDDQETLEKATGMKVTRIAFDLIREARLDASVQVAAFEPLFEAIGAVPQTVASVLVDVAASRETSVLDVFGLIDLEEELAAMSLPALFFVPTVAAPEAMRQAADTIVRIRQAVPSAAPVLALNERDGRFTEFFPGSPADRVWKERLEPLSHQVRVITIPRVPPASWLPFERLQKRPAEIVGAAISEIQSWTGLSRPLAKLARGDVAAWLDAVDRQLRSVIDFGRKEEER
jgi:hypothetical protein